MPIFGGPNVDKLKSKGDVDGLIKAIEQKDDEVAIAAMNALADIKPNQAIEPIRAQLGSASDARRLAAVKELGEMRSESGFKALVEFIANNHVLDVEAAVKELIVRAGETVVVGFLMDDLPTMSAAYRRKLVTVFSWIEGKRVTKALKTLTEDSDQAVSTGAAELLKQRGG